MTTTKFPAYKEHEIAKEKPDLSLSVQPIRKRPAGRPSRFAKFEAFEAELTSPMHRPAYCDGVGIYRGAKETTVFVKLTLPRGGMYRGRSIKPGGSVEHKLGKRSSFDWSQMLAERDRLQGLADRGEPLEAVSVETFATYALDWLERRKPNLNIVKNNIGI